MCTLFLDGKGDWGIKFLDYLIESTQQRMSSYMKCSTEYRIRKYSII